MWLSVKNMLRIVVKTTFIKRRSCKLCLAGERAPELAIIRDIEMIATEANIKPLKDGSGFQFYDLRKTKRTLPDGIVVYTIKSFPAENPGLFHFGNK